MASETVTIRIDGTFTVSKDSLVVCKDETGKDVDVSNLSVSEINELIETDCYLHLAETICSAIEEKIDISII